MIAQAVFFSLLARLFESPDQERFLLIGYAVAVGAANVAWTIQSTTWDRWMGTYPLLVIAPSSLAPAVMGRTSIWLPAGVATTLVTLSFMAIVFDLALPWPAAVAVVPLVVLTSLSTYCFTLYSSERWPSVSPVPVTSYTSVITIGARAFCGVSVPVSFWPEGVQIVVQFLPITHGSASDSFTARRSARQPGAHVGIPGVGGGAGLDHPRPRCDGSYGKRWQGRRFN